MKYVATLFILFFLMSCTSHENFIQIDVEKDIKKEVVLKLSQVIDSLEYIRLETDSNCLIGDNFKIALLDDEILTFTKKKCLLFDRKTGEFAREILHRGKDKEGYMFTMAGKGMVANEEERYIFLKEWNGNLSTYFIDTRTKREIPYQSFGSIAYVNDSVLAATLLNVDGKQKNRMLLYENYVCKDSIPVNQTFELKSNAISLLDNEDMFYRSAGKTYYKHIMDDTVYQVTNNTLVPSFAFYSGDKSPKIELKEHQERMYELMKEMYVVSGIMETHSFIFYEITYRQEKYDMVYDKKSGKGGRLKTGLINDLDNEMDVWPDHITAKGEYVFIVNPSLLDESLLNKHRLREDDNPMIVVGHAS